MHQNTENIPGLCFICFRCKMIENRWKMNKVCIISSFSPSTFKTCQNQSLGIYFVRKVTKGPLEITSCHNYSFGEKFQKLSKLVPELFKVVKNGPWDFKSWKISKWFVYYWGLASFTPFWTLEEWQIQPSIYVELQNWSLLFTLNQTGPLILKHPKYKSNPNTTTKPKLITQPIP